MTSGSKPILTVLAFWFNNIKQCEREREREREIVTYWYGSVEVESSSCSGRIGTERCDMIVSGELLL